MNTEHLTRRIRESTDRHELESIVQELQNHIKVQKGSLFSVVHESGETLLSLVGHKKSHIIRSVSQSIVMECFTTFSMLEKLHFITTLILSNGDHCGGLSEEAKWQTNIVCMELLSITAKTEPALAEALLTILIPILTNFIWHTKKQVQLKARETMLCLTNTISNEDIRPFIPSLIEAIIEPENVQDCVYALAGTTFVNTVKASALSLTVPILERGFKERNTTIKRKCAVITENLAKLVKNPNDVSPFLDVLCPALEKGLNEISDPECRERFSKADQSLKHIVSLMEAPRDVFMDLSKEFEANTFVKDSLSMLTHITQLELRKESIETHFASLLTNVQIEKVILITDTFGSNTEKQKPNENDENLICDITFSLAYGTNILLNDSKLTIQKGCKYGIIANKSAGKTTLMRAIANGQIDGFPSAEEVRTIFIENDIQGEQQEMNVVQFVQDTVAVEHHTSDVTEEDIRQMLESIGFTSEMVEGPITSLSGGWKMKLALGRATLQKADIMLMDEPTNHLDVLNVQWVVDYIHSLDTVTCLIVSHDTNFLDKTVDHIIHFENLKLYTHTGNVSEFIKIVPDAKRYFELGSSSLQFSFPVPTILQSGSKSNRGRTLLQMKNVSFTYPSAKSAQLSYVNVKASMASRVAIVGANGAGKSTLIKLLTGELKPSAGEVKKHPNCRFAYVAQHAFHHIEQHLDKSPSKYICWRYQSGEDKEEDTKETLEITDEEQLEMDKPWHVTWTDSSTGEIHREKRFVEKLMSRRKSKKTYEYEVRWKKKSMDDNTWYSRDSLCNKGFEKMLNALDTRLAAVESMNHRPLTNTNVTKHLAAVGLESEHANHSRIRDLSGGQKVKVVLAACTWACPHLIILDEPTNYLDRDSLGALANAINDFEGGVVLITHNKEFADLTTRETWVVANNICDVKGDPEWEKYASEQQTLMQETLTSDASGNKIEIKKIIQKISEMTRKEVKKNKKNLKEKINNDEDLETHELEWSVEWNLL